MKRYSVETLKKILGKIEYVRHRRETSRWDLIFATAKLTDVGSSWNIQIGGGGQGKGSVLDKYERKDLAEARNKAYSRIEKLIMECFYCIDPEYRIYVYDLYLRPDRKKLKNSPAAEAERYGYDRRKFVPQLNEAMERSLNTETMSRILDEIRNIANENGIEELIQIFSEEESIRNSAVGTECDTHLQKK